MSALDAAVAAYQTQIGRLGDHRGHCACGDPDARHRAAADIAHRYAAGDDANLIAADHGITAVDVLELAAAWHDVQNAAAARGVPAATCPGRWTR